MDVKTVQLSNKVNFEYVEHGNVSGIPVICLHGYTDSWKSFELVLPYLSETLHTFALSQRGHGNSDRPSEGYDPRDFAADVAFFIDQMNLGPSIIVGHSMGGTVAQRFVLDYPQKTKALVLICSFSTFANNQGVIELQGAVSQLNDPVDPAFVQDFQKSTVAKPINNTFLRTVCNESLKVPARVWKTVLAGLMNVDYIKELQTVRKPVLLVWGDLDTFSTSKDQDRLLEAIAGSRLSVYTGVGHSVHWEEPQRFALEVENFVDEVQ